MSVHWHSVGPATIIEGDVIVVGSGIAGLSAALGLHNLAVHIITKSELDSGSASNWAQGGMAAAMADDDSPTLHAKDTFAASAGLGDPQAIELLTSEAPHAIESLVELGAQFDRNPSGELEFGREAAHSRWRILHAGGDATGAEVVRALSLAVRECANISVFEHSAAIDLVADDSSRIVGVLVERDGQSYIHLGKAVVLATGGSGQLYKYSTNPATATGDGLAMAARAGAILADLEFVQFHPTALNVANDPLPLLTEALRGEGATLVDGSGDRFMLREHPDAELGSRDVVARGIWSVLERGDQAYLDCTRFSSDEFMARFPTIWERANSFGLDPSSDLLPVVPAAHYQMGGISVDLVGQTSLPGLWACGEVASSGVHGANRLASNSLIEAYVFGGRVAESVSSHMLPPGQELSIPAGILDGTGNEQILVTELRELMWRYVGLVRNDDGLDHAIRRLTAMLNEVPADAIELRNLVQLGCIVAQCAKSRTESRGAHYRTDFPIPDPELGHRTSVVWTSENSSVVVIHPELSTVAGGS